MPLIQRSLRNICIAVMLVYYHYINAVEDSIDACKFTYDDVKWDYIGKFNDVATYKWKREDSKLIVVRGTTVLNHHPSEIMGIFLNTSLATKWVDMLRSQIVFKTSNKDSLIFHQSYDMPWPVTDRDFVLLVEPMFDKIERRIVINVKSIEDDRVPEVQDIIRAHSDLTTWKLICVNKNCSTTAIDVATSADMKGTIPAFIINQLQKMWPTTTINNLRKLVEKKASEPLDIIRDW